jgi:3-hydroxybutyryl-CoA dehydrogenase
MIQTIAVLGAGTMGHGIAQLLAQHGFQVRLYDPFPAALPAARATIQRNVSLELQGQAGQSSALARLESNISYTSDLTEAVPEADLIIEAAPEQLEIKRELYQKIARLVKNDAIIGSNTSTYALETLASQQPFAERMLITHFFFPAPLVPLVEIVQLPTTKPGIAREVVDLLTRCGKSAVLLKKDIPGFIANRLQAAVAREAFNLLQAGVADIEQIDRAMKDGPGMRWAISGPFEIIDFGGLDVWAKVTGHLFPELDNSVTAPEPLLEKVREGQLGIKSGQGFYDYTDPDYKKRRPQERDQQLTRILKAKTAADQQE